MCVMVTEILELVPESSSLVLIVNYHKFQWQLFNARGFRAQDQACLPVEFNGGNMLYIAGAKQLYRGYIRAIDAAERKVIATAVAPKELLRTYVAKRNRTTGAVRLVEVESCQLNHVSHDRRMQLQHSNSEPVDLRKLMKLLQKFNSKSSQKLLELMHGRHFDLGIMEEKLRQTINDKITDYAEQSAATTEVAHKAAHNDEHEGVRIETLLRAKANPHASSLRDLYQAEDLIGVDVLRCLTEPAKQLLQMPPEELAMVNDYLTNSVKALMQSPDVISESNLAQVRVCLFMDVLARLIDRKLNQRVGSRGQISPFTAVLDRPIREQFLQHCLRYSSAELTVSKYTRHKALLYYLALVFVLEMREQVPIETIHRSLQIPMEELVAVARSIGAKADAKRSCFVKGQLTAVKTESLAVRSRGKRSYKR